MQYVVYWTYSDINGKFSYSCLFYASDEELYNADSATVSPSDSLWIVPGTLTE